MDNNLQLGDIMVFKAGNDWIGKSIAWITNSNVSHAAMVCRKQSIVEMGPSGISVSAVNITPGDEVYIMRFEPQRDTLPLVKAADAYINAKTRYDFPALVILAGLLIYRAIRPTQKLVLIGDLILRAACKEMDKLIQSLILHNPDKAMICSQLVYQIYNDCGNDYRIQLEGGDLQGSAHAQENGFVRLIDLLDKAPVQACDTQEEMTDTAESPEELARQLFEAMQEDNTASDCLAAPDLGPLLALAKKFLEELELFLEKSKQNIPLDALFVTPGDLLNHAKNLQQVQTLRVERIK